MSCLISSDCYSSINLSSVLFKNVNMTSGYLYVKKMATAKQMTYQDCLCGFLKLVRSLIFKYQSWSWLLKLIAETGLGS